MTAIRGAVLLLALGACRAAEPSPGPTSARRGIVLFYVDDLGWRDVGFQGGPFRTPQADRLAAAGRVFTQAYSNGPNCAPSRASLMSGWWTPRHGVYTVGDAARGRARDRRLVPVENRTELPLEVVTLAEALRGAGYRTASIGKWHLGHDSHGPSAQGFDVNVGGNQRGHPRSYFAPYQNPDLVDGPDGEYLTDRLTEEACRFLREPSDQPFFLFLTHYAVHTPIQAPADHVQEVQARDPDRSPREATYAAMVERMDRSLGRVMETLTELGCAADTLVVFTSDNGGLGSVTSMAPLRGSKGMLYEGGIRVPLVVHWPAGIPPGVEQVPVTALDLLPTLLQWAGAADPAPARDGRSLLPVLRAPPGSPPPDWAGRSLYWHFPAYLEGSQQGARDARFRTRPAAAIRRGPWKLHQYFEDGAVELYHLEEDPGEAEDRSAAEPEVARRLLEDLHRWQARLGAFVPAEPNPRYQPSGDGPDGTRRPHP